MLAENTKNLCWIWLDRYTISPGNRTVILFSGIVSYVLHEKILRRHLKKPISMGKKLTVFAVYFLLSLFAH